MTQMLFETFNVPAMFGSTGGMLSLLASGRTTGCVVECGDGVAHVAPVQEGYIERRVVVRVAVGGADVTEHMRLLLGEQGYYPTTTAELETVQRIKETMTYVAMDVHTERKIPSTSMDKPYTLPDGTVIYLGSERFRCPEVLFDPTLIGKEAPGIHECAVEAIRKCDAMSQTDLYRNIVLSGGTTLFPGLRERLSKEMIVSPLVPGNLESEVRVVAPPERKYTAWIGGSILASLSTFQSMWISKAEYGESGTSIIHRKCFL
jgi:actin beta/gamma 1